MSNIRGNPEVIAKPKVEVVDPKNIPHVLLPGELGLALELTVKDKNGKVTEHRVQKSESFLAQFLQLLYVQMTYQPDSIMSVRDTSNVLRDVKSYLSTGTGNRNVTFDMANVANDTTFGILVGTGNTAPTITDYMMETLIAHGVGAGQLQYGAVTFGAPASDATTSQITVTRNFANGSGGAITVNEIGLACRAVYGTGTSIENFLIVRDVIGGGINVPNGQTLTVNYRPQATI
jgi:predicted outer membrane repeat protein